MLMLHPVSAGVTSELRLGDDTFVAIIYFAGCLRSDGGNRTAAGFWRELTIRQSFYFLSSHSAVFLFVFGIVVVWVRCERVVSSCCVVCVGGVPLEGKLSAGSGKTTFTSHLFKYLMGRVRSHFGSSHFGSSHFGSRFAFAGTERFHPLVVPAMSNASSTRSGDRKVYVPTTLSELHRRHGRAKQFCSKTDCNGSFCAYDVLRSHENGRPIAWPKCSGTFAKPRLFSDDGSLVRPLGKEPRGGKAPATKSTTERERQLEAQVKDL